MQIVGPQGEGAARRRRGTLGTQAVLNWVMPTLSLHHCWSLARSHTSYPQPPLVGQLRGQAIRFVMPGRLPSLKKTSMDPINMELEIVDRADKYWHLSAPLPFLSFGALECAPLPYA